MDKALNIQVILKRSARKSKKPLVMVITNNCAENYGALLADIFSCYTMNKIASKTFTCKVRMYLARAQVQYLALQR